MERLTRSLAGARGTEHETEAARLAVEEVRVCPWGVGVRVRVFGGGRRVVCREEGGSKACVGQGSEG